MAKRKLNYRFHNPNPVEVTAEYILKVMIETNAEKVEKALQEEMEQRRGNNANKDNISSCKVPPFLSMKTEL